MVAFLPTQMLVRLERRDRLLELQLLLEFKSLPIGSQEMLLWAALDHGGQAWLRGQAHAGSGAAREQLPRLRQLLSGQPLPQPPLPSTNPTQPVIPLLRPTPMGCRVGSGSVETATEAPRHTPRPGDKGAVLQRERHRLHAARDANERALRGGDPPLAPAAAAAEAERRHLAAVLQAECPSRLAWVSCIPPGP